MNTNSKWTVCGCGREMVPGGGCAANFETPKVPRIPHGGNAGQNCGDCNVAPGNFHHVGCDCERCAFCGIGQAIWCDCYEWQKAHANGRSVYVKR
jgi:hypothetical protein